MSTQTLSSVASNVVGQYTQVGKLIVGRAIVERPD